MVSVNFTFPLCSQPPRQHPDSMAWKSFWILLMKSPETKKCIKTSCPSTKSCMGRWEWHCQATCAMSCVDVRRASMTYTCTFCVTELWRLFSCWSKRFNTCRNKLVIMYVYFRNGWTLCLSSKTSTPTVLTVDSKFEAKLKKMFFCLFVFLGGKKLNRVLSFGGTHRRTDWIVFSFCLKHL